MNRYKVIFNTGATAADKQYIYNVYISNTLIYTGKAFKIASQESIRIDLTDIFGDYQYKGYGIIKPEWVDGAYKQQQVNEVSLSANPSVEKGLHYASARVDLMDGEIRVAQQPVAVYFHNIPFEGISDQTILNSNLTYHFGSLIPRFPKLRTKNLRYAQLVNSNANRQPVWTNGTNTMVSFLNTNGSRIIGRDLAIIVPMLNNSNDMYSNGVKIAHFDECVGEHDYYLMWLTDNGGMQCQRFRSSSTYTEESTRNMKLSTDDMNDVANSTIKGKWKLKSDNLTDAQYDEYMAITRSPYLLLYIPKMDRVVYVNVTDTSMEKKRFQTNNRKIPYFEVNVESREHLVSMN